MHRILELLSLQFRVLYRQFLLRIVDLEALSVQADVAGFLGKIAGLLIMVGLVHAFIVVSTPGDPTDPGARLVFAGQMMHHLIATMMLAIGLFTVIGWDSTFLGRRDVLVLAPLPVAPRMILFAKVAAWATLLGVAVLALNVATGITMPSIFAQGHDSNWAFLRSSAAYWFTMIAASLFIYCSVLTVQGLAALLLPRKLFLRLSALLQLGAFILFLGVYFLQPSVATPAAMTAPENQQLLAWAPSSWFLALFEQLDGSLHPALAWLAGRAWMALGAVVAGAAASLLLCYMRTLRRTVEEPDLIPTARSWTRMLRLGSPLHTAIGLFSLRALMRSRQHRVILAFYLGVGFAITLVCVNFHEDMSAPATAGSSPLGVGLIISTIMMMNFAVVGLCRTFALPISLKANWILRITQFNPPEEYIAATRRLLLLFAVAPVWFGSAMFLLCFSSWQYVAAHLVVLGLLGCILADLNLLGFYKVPFTCSYLPGKSNTQFRFWGFLLVFAPLTLWGAEHEQGALDDPVLYTFMIGALGTAATGIWMLNRHRAKSAVLYFEELPLDETITLSLIYAPTPAGTKSQMTVAPESSHKEV